MEYRSLGSTELRPSVIGLGCARLGKSIFEDNTRQAIRLLEAGFESGVNFFDTASTYCYGDSEALIGKTFAGRRDKVLFATKGGFQYSNYARIAQHFLPVLAPARALLMKKRSRLKGRSKKRQDFSLPQLRTDLERSLKRLRTDYVDLYQLHSPPESIIASDEVRSFLESLVKEGKARYCGASIYSSQEARRCLEYPIYSAVQIGFSLVDQEPASVIFPLAQSKGIGIIVNTPLHRGVLTDRLRVLTGPAPEQPDNALEQRRRSVTSFFGDNENASLANAALRFVIDHDAVATVLTGTCSVDHLRQNLAAVANGPLPPDVIRKARELKKNDFGISKDG